MNQWHHFSNLHYWNLPKTGRRIHGIWVTPTHQKKTSTNQSANSHPWVIRNVAFHMCWLFQREASGVGLSIRDIFRANCWRRWHHWNGLWNDRTVGGQNLSQTGQKEAEFKSEALGNDSICEWNSGIQVVFQDNLKHYQLNSVKNNW